MDETWMQNAQFLIIDDQEYNISLLERILRRAGFNHLHCTTEPKRLEDLFEEVKPDIILLDLHMPEMDGFAALKRLKELVQDVNYLPILVLTADVTQEAKKEALHLGAHDFLTKPLDKTEVVLRINNLLKTRFYYLQLQDQNYRLEQRVRERTSELEQAKLEILQLLGRASEFRDDQTGQHTQRVGKMAKEIAEALGLPKHEVDLIERATPLHDLGKIGIPDDILLKPGRFTPDEFDHMKTHTTIGASILEGSLFRVLQLAGTIALSHHEKWDGTGYPNGLSGEDIPLAGRIVAIADFYDALTHERPYKPAWSEEEALEEIRKQRGIHFDPKVVDAFMGIWQRNSNSNLKWTVLG
ncbi:HD-GYP domain-containing protein [Paenibacillus planticolens]|uniref:Response regulator n=1 Tax=Paenibacillus planticolens TaxID=2654976 RepID=A0ABX1ZWX6_9BACL|nr:HD domain-containing phosphohydrolase [Paenibacillus planticolens]NOV04373.1 response regulator [Paenibacillus planticolens]